jgi:hypothetical protein
MDKVMARVLLIAMALSFLAFAPRTVRAQAPLQPTQIIIGAPATPNLGELVTVQAVLADGQGHPISKARIYFTTQAKFLGDKGNVVLAEALTNASGQAVAKFTDDFSAGIAMQAEFRGDSQYAASNATVQLGAAGQAQVYSEHVGVDLPGFNVPPIAAPVAAIQSSQPGFAQFVEGLWPAMNGWPVAAVLLLVWSMYLLTVTYVVRLARMGSEPEERPEFDARRSP